MRAKTCAWDITQVGEVGRQGSVGFPVMNGRLGQWGNVSEQRFPVLESVRTTLSAGEDPRCLAPATEVLLLGVWGGALESTGRWPLSRALRNAI